MNLSERELQDFQTCFPWFTGTRLSDGRILGNKDRMKEKDDPIFSILKDNFALKDKTVIEFGCAEGTLTVYLAELVKKVISLEVRPKNIAALLTRLFVHGIHNVDVWLKDVSIAENWKCDLLFHAGVLYHLSNPVEHLLSLKNVADELLLDTHYYTDDLNFSKSGDGYIYKDGDWANPYAGTSPDSCWLRKELIIKLLYEIGYKTVEIKRDYKVFDLPRFTIAAKK